MADIFIYDGHISSSDGFNIQVSESNAMIVSHSFNITDGARSHIGIGGAPHNSYALHLSGSGIRVDGAGGFTTTNHLFFEGAGNHYIKHNGGTAASDNIIFRFSDNEDVLTISGDGQVGIGTTAPLRTFEVAGTGATLRVAPDYLTSVGTTDRDYIELQADNSDTKIVSPNERFHIENPGGMGADGHIILTAAGGIGIGTTSPTAKLEVIGDISGSIGTTGSFDGAVKVKDRLAIGAPNLASTSDLIIGD